MKKTNKDSWKSYIDQHRDEFDAQAPKDLWNNIEAELDNGNSNRSNQNNAPSNPNQRPKTVELWKVYRAAAVVILLFGAGFFAMYSHFNNLQTAAQEPTEKPEELPTEYPLEFREAESYYTAEIEQNLEQLKRFSDDATVIEELDLLKKEFDDLKEEMGDHVNDERIIKALIENYRLRLELLKEILEELKVDDTLIKEERYEASFS